MADERIRVIVDGDAKGLKQAAGEAVAAITGVDAATKKAQVSQDRAAAGTRRQTRDTRGLTAEVKVLDNAVTKFNRNITATRNGLALLRFPSIAAGAAILAKELAAVAGGLTAVTAAGGPAIGVLAGVGQAGTAAAQGIVTLKLATHGLAEAVKAQTKADLAAPAAARQSAAGQEAANRRIEDSHRRLTQARKEARQEIEQLTRAVTAAGHAEEAADLTLREAIRRRRELVNTPGVDQLELEGADLAVRDARDQLRQQRRAAAEARTDADRAQARGVEKSQQVIDAQRDLADATEQAADAATSQAAAVTAAQQAMDKLPASAQRFVKLLLANKPKLDELRKVAADGFLPGAGSGFTAALRNFDVARRVVGDTADVFGDLADEAGRLVGSKGFGRDFERIARTNNRLLEQTGGAALDLTEAFQDTLISAEPLVEWMGDLTEQAGKQIKAWADTGRKTGEASDFFRESKEVLEDLGAILGNTASGLKNVGTAGKETGRELIDELRDVTEGWRDWTGSVDGQNSLREYFENAKPAVEQTGGLLADITGAFFRLGSQPGTAELISQLRTDLVPALEQLLGNLGEGLGPALVDGITNLVQLFAELSEADGGLTVTVKLLSDLVGLLESIVSQSGVVKTALAVAFTGFSLYKLLGIGAALKGIDRIADRIRRARAGGPLVGSGPAAPVIVGPSGPRSGTRKSPGGVILPPGKTARSFEPPIVGTTPGGGGVGKGVRALGGKALRAVPVLGTGLILNDMVGNPLGGALKALGGGGGGVPVAQQLTQLSRGMMFKGGQPGAGVGLGAAAKDIEAAVKAGDATKLKALATHIEAIGKALGGLPQKRLDGIVSEVRRAAGAAEFRQLQGVVKDITREFDEMRQKSTGDVKAIRSATAENFAKIKTTLGTETAAGKDALATNFRAAAAEVQKSMDAGVISTQEGTREIHRLMKKALAVYGIKGKEADNYLRGDGVGTKGENERSKYAGGGIVGNLGERGRDTVPALLGRGEAVLNHHQQKPVEVALRRTFGVGLADLFRRVNTPHYAGGGIVDIPWAPGEEIAAGILPLVTKLHGRFGVGVSDAFDRDRSANHKSPGHNVTGTAVDFTGSPEQLNALVAWAVQAGYTTYFDGSHGSINLPPHGPNHHAHVEFGGGGGGGAGLRAVSRVKLDQVNWTGPGGALAALGQAGLKGVRGGAQARLDDIAGFATGGFAGLPTPGMVTSDSLAGQITGLDLDFGFMVRDHSRDGQTTKDELASQITLKTQIRDLTAQRATAVQAALGELASGMKARKDRLVEIAAWLKASTARVKKLQRRLSRVNEQLTKAKGSKRKRLLSERDAIRSELGNELKQARKFTKERDDLRDVQLPNWETEQSTYQQLAGIEGVPLSVRQLNADLADLGATTPTNTEGASNLGDLYRDLYEKSESSRLLGLAQRGVFEGMSGLVSGRLLGAFAHGGAVPQTGPYLLHKDEYVVPDPRGPYGMNGTPATVQTGAGPVEVTLIMQGDLGRLWRAVDARVRVAGADQGARARVLTAAPGGR